MSAPDRAAPTLRIALTAAIRDRESARLTATWAAANALAPIAILQGEILPGEVAHFGYRDGFSQPTIDGGLPSLIADTLPPAPAGAFVFGYPSQFRDFTYPTPVPNEFGANGSFLALRVLEQDCAAEGDGCDTDELAMMTLTSCGCC